MNTEALFLFLILLLGLLLCSFLGGNCGKEGLTGNFTANFNMSGDGNGSGSTSSGSTSSGSTSSGSTSSGGSSSSTYDNYNHYTGGSTQLTTGSTFYGQNGTTAVVVTNSDGTQSLQITLPGSSTPVTFTPQQTTSTDASSSTVESYTNYYGNNGSITTYYGPNGDTATIVNGNNGQQAIKVTTSSGTYYYNVSGSNNTSTQYYGSTGTSIQQSPSATAYSGPYGGSAGSVNGPYGGSAGSVTGPYGNTAYYAQGPYGNTVAGTSGSYYNPPGYNPPGAAGPYNPPGYNPPGSDYYNSLPPGIPASQIPPGQEDLYILKSEVVPPVCPACPTSSACPRQEPCPPCPACARCPEPAFECKKVPNYDAINNDYLPAPVLNDFSQFGM
jgi:hypothetical protein